MTNKGFVFRFWAGITAILVLTASVGIAVNVHYCQDTVKSIGVYALADECSMEDSNSGKISLEMCEVHNAVINKTCCHNESFFNKIATELSSQLDNFLSQESEVIEVVSVVANLELLGSVDEAINMGLVGPISENRQVLYQSFRI